MKPKVKLFKRGEQYLLIVTPKVSQNDFQKIVTEYFTDRILKFKGKEIAVTGGQIGSFFEAIRGSKAELMDTENYTTFTISNEARWGYFEENAEEPEELNVFCHHDISSFFRAYLHGTFQYHFFRSCIDEIVSL